MVNLADFVVSFDDPLREFGKLVFESKIGGHGRRVPRYVRLSARLGRRESGSESLSYKCAAKMSGLGRTRTDAAEREILGRCAHGYFWTQFYARRFGRTNHYSLSRQGLMRQLNETANGKVCRRMLAEGLYPSLRHKSLTARRLGLFSINLGL
jgi:hypothetical protein